ncbi:gluconate 2-dehydrogenase subunit 3 family protein [Salinibacter altiplanensis]|uniref:gluconate 2-dehydrogenase subunit 3 family protein n=1 Tax=Salinibacter altiplanensis TaxID=1803181 RepID=UPI000C9F0052|nr:gluconate 2-dehydrogenase subunit 3 family protein [Salinibacter altiplanensis]
MSDLSRRDALKLLGLMAAAPTFSVACSSEEVQRAREQQSQSAPTQPEPQDYDRRLFTDHEHETVCVLVDWIIPADDRSGSATDAGVPAFIDFILTDEALPDRDEQQAAFRGGLAWVDYTCLDRHDAPFIECTEAQQQALLDDIAWPEAAGPTMRPGVEFFNSLRDLTASGFFSSEMGMEDLQYQGNQFVAEWTGCPDRVIQHIGLDAT